MFDNAYDEMSWGEICCRLPGELAVKAVKRRILNLETLSMFFDAVGRQPQNANDIKMHINGLIENSSLDDIFDAIDQAKHPILFNWLDDRNIKRIKEGAQDKLSTVFKFNLANDSDEEILLSILDEILSEQIDSIGSGSSSRIRAVLEKADVNVFNKMAQTVLKDSRPEVRASVLGINNHKNMQSLTHMERMVALKAFAKLPNTSTLPHVGRLDFKLFAELKPLERLGALEMYLNYFPNYKKISPFAPMCTEQEFHFLLFAESIAFHDRVVALNNKFKDITEMDPPVSDDSDDDDY